MSDAQTASALTLDLAPQADSQESVAAPQKTSAALKFERTVAKVERRNFTLGLWNGIIYALGTSFMSRTTIIPSFLSHLTDSSALIGIVSQFENIGWYLPQLFFSSFVVHRAQKMPLYRTAAVIRSLSFLTMGIVTVIALKASVLLPLFIFAYGLYHFSAGMGGVVFMELLAKAIPTSKRGRFLSLRISVGSILTATLGALLVTTFFEWGKFPQDFGYLYLIGAVLTAISLLLMAIMREPRTYNAPEPRSVAEQFKIGFSFFRTDKRFNRYVKARLLLSTWTIGVPFLVLFAQRVLHFTLVDLGLFVAVECAGQVVSNFFWERITDRKSPKRTLIVSTWLAILLPLILFSFQYFPIPTYLYSIIFALSAAIDSGISVGGMSYIVEIAPSGERSTYVGLFNTMMAFPCFLTAGAGLLLDILGFTTLYSIVLLVAIVGLFYVLRLTETRTQAGLEAAL